MEETRLCLEEFPTQGIAIKDGLGFLFWRRSGHDFAQESAENAAPLEWRLLKLIISTKESWACGAKPAAQPRVMKTASA
jgi:hypothetical protein